MFIGFSETDLTVMIEHNNMIDSFFRALKDAEKAIHLSKEWPKGYFRKGRALAGLRMFSEAEDAFTQVLKLDKNCEDAVQELLRVRTYQLTEMGFSRQQAESAIKQHGTVQTALDSLLAGVGQYISPRNPEGLTALWVGNVLPDKVDEKKLLKIFSKYGSVTSVRCLPEKYCAFINFKTKEAAVNGSGNVTIRKTTTTVTTPSSSQQVKQQTNSQPVGYNVLCHGYNGFCHGYSGICHRYYGLCHGYNGLCHVDTMTCAMWIQWFMDTVVCVMGTVAYVMWMQWLMSWIQWLVSRIKWFSSWIERMVSAVSTTTTTNGQNQPKVSGPVNGDECYFWRTTGCSFGDKCRNKHIPSHAGIDKKPWQKSQVSSTSAATR
ncbi:hypothetical protein KUTeg_005060 [Tegillarca granosa]|uniref:Uncharacterized protein n=1 Tax=Tegillarca granosa TaxID=220873 RepID=A0ABQ9FLU3_TEGGR|nr:hypothetical protein KUTeg_005060 [Tegillarca granosa]